jgi:hypothetical protein
MRDTFLNLFPAYGVSPDRASTEGMAKLRYDDYNFVEARKTTDVDRSHFAKLDEMKKYTEEWLKTQNMRGKK